MSTQGSSDVVTTESPTSTTGIGKVDLLLCFLFIVLKKDDYVKTETCRLPPIDTHMPLKLKQLCYIVLEPIFIASMLLWK